MIGLVYGFSRAVTALFDVLVAPFGANHTLALVVLSLVAGVAMIFMFKATSDQFKIKRERARFSARVLEMRLYQDSLVLIFKAFFAALWTIPTYLRVSFKPIAVLVLFVAVIFIQLDERYGRAALTPGQSAIVTVGLDAGLDPMTTDVHLDTADGINVETRPVRVSRDREVTWRVRVQSTGRHSLAVQSMDQVYQLPIITAPHHKSVGHVRHANSVVDALIHPSLPQIPRESPLSSVSVTYPPADHALFGWHTHWLVVFMIFSFVGALIPKFVFRIEV